jgi:inner membrane transporter RhtA
MSREATGSAMAIGSLIFIQIGLALSIELADQLGTNGAGWIRMAWAGLLMLLAFGRRCCTGFTPQTFAASVVLGLVTVAITLCFQAALGRIPLGTACALNFIGPLVLAVVVGRPRRFVWPLVAAVGVLLLTEPWAGAIDPLGVLYALGAGALWASYIVLTQRIGDRVAGLDGLALSMVVSGVVSTAIVGPTVIPRLTWHLIVISLGIAVLCPVLPFLLEFWALRRLSTGVFSTLMAVEPAFGMLAGFVILNQVPDVYEACGIGLVIVAAFGAARGGARMEAVGAPIVGSR